MRVLKFGKTIFGAQLTAAEKKALSIEVRKEAAEHDRKFAIELESMLLWRIRQKLGWGPKRLREFYDTWDRDIEALISRYELEEEDDIWLCTQMLKNEGIDVEQWYKEKERNRETNGS